MNEINVVVNAVDGTQPIDICYFGLDLIVKQLRGGQQQDIIDVAKDEKLVEDRSTALCILHSYLCRRRIAKHTAIYSVKSNDLPTKTFRKSFSDLGTSKPLPDTRDIDLQQYKHEADCAGYVRRLASTNSINVNLHRMQREYTGHQLGDDMIREIVVQQKSEKQIKTFIRARAMVSEPIDTDSLDVQAYQAHLSGNPSKPQFQGQQQISKGKQQQSTSQSGYLPLTSFQLVPDADTQTSPSPSDSNTVSLSVKIRDIVSMPSPNLSQQSRSKQIQRRGQNIGSVETEHQVPGTSQFDIQSYDSNTQIQASSQCIRSHSSSFPDTSYFSAKKSPMASSLQPFQSARTSSSIGGGVQKLPVNFYNRLGHKVTLFKVEYREYNDFKSDEEDDLSIIFPTVQIVSAFYQDLGGLGKRSVEPEPSSPSTISAQRKKIKQTKLPDQSQGQQTINFKLLSQFIDYEAKNMRKSDGSSQFDTDQLALLQQSGAPHIVPEGDTNQQLSDIMQPQFSELQQPGLQGYNVDYQSLGVGQEANIPSMLNITPSSSTAPRKPPIPGVSSGMAPLGLHDQPIAHQHAIMGGLEPKLYSNLPTSSCSPLPASQPAPLIPPTLQISQDTSQLEQVAPSSSIIQFGQYPSPDHSLTHPPRVAPQRSSSTAVPPTQTAQTLIQRQPNPSLCPPLPPGSAVGVQQRQGSGQSHVACSWPNTADLMQHQQMQQNDRLRNLQQLITAGDGSGSSRSSRAHYSTSTVPVLTGTSQHAHPFYHGQPQSDTLSTPLPSGSGVQGGHVMYSMHSTPPQQARYQPAQPQTGMVYMANPQQHTLSRDPSQQHYVPYSSQQPQQYVNPVFQSGMQAYGMEPVLPATTPGQSLESLPPSSTPYTTSMDAPQHITRMPCHRGACNIEQLAGSWGLGQVCATGVGSQREPALPPALAQAGSGDDDVECHERKHAQRQVGGVGAVESGITNREISKK